MFEGSRQSFVKSFQMTLIKALQRCSAAACTVEESCSTAWYWKWERGGLGVTEFSKLAQQVNRFFPTNAATRRRINRNFPVKVETEPKSIISCLAETFPEKLRRSRIVPEFVCSRSNRTSAAHSPRAAFHFFAALRQKGWFLPFLQFSQGLVD